MNDLREISDIKINATSHEFVRFLWNTIDWNNRLVGISGAKGAGKTTLILQYMKTSFGFSEDAIYLELDHIYFAENSLYDYARQFEKTGGKILFLDEVHKYRNWSHDLKLIYDNLPSIKVVFTSSSALEIYKGSHDLSRRVVLYQLPGLSLREFVHLKYKLELPLLALDEIISKSREISLKLSKDIKPIKYYNEYIQKGYYPFFTENENMYHEKLLNVLNVVLENDLPIIFKIDFNSVVNLKKLLSIISRLVPYKPNIKKLAEQIGVTRETLLRYLFYLEKAQILKRLGKDTHGINFLNKPEKLFLQNTNLIYALSQTMTSEGNIRETFFLNQTIVGNMVAYSEKGDFKVNQKYVFEVGGKSKSQKQIEGIPNAFVVKDNIEYSTGNTIPLWMFGLLY